MAIDVVLTHGKHFQLECYCQLVLVNFFGLQLRKKKFNYKKNLQLFLSFSTMFYSQDVVENIVAKGDFSTSVNGSQRF